MSVLPAAQRILVTGADGLLGRHVLETWRGSRDIHALVRRAPDRPIEGVSYIAMDLAGPLDFARLPARVDAVIHLAQSPHMRDFPDAASDIYAVNTASTAQLLDWARRAGAGHFLLASTGGLYAPSAAPLTEESRLDPPRGPLGFYFDTKLCSEILVRAYEGQMHTVILRPFFIYGPGQRETMLLPRLIANVREGRALPVRGGRGTRLNPIFAGDAVDALATCLAADAPGVLNLAGPEVLTIRDIALHIGALIGREPLFDAQEGEADSVVADISRLRQRLTAPMTRFRDGIAEMVGSMEGNPAQPVGDPDR